MSVIVGAVNAGAVVAGALVIVVLFSTGRLTALARGGYGSPASVAPGGLASNQPEAEVLMVPVGPAAAAVRAERK